MIDTEPRPEEEPADEVKKIAAQALNKFYGSNSKFAIKSVFEPIEINSNAMAGAASSTLIFSPEEKTASPQTPSSAPVPEDVNKPYDQSMTSPSREEMKHALQATQSDVSAIAEKLRADFAEHRGDMKAAIETFRADMYKSTSETVKWAVGTALTLAAVSVTILTFVINNAAKVPQVQQPQQQQPVIVNVMPSAQPTAIPPAK